METESGLVFAVVAPGVELGRVLAFLRYVRRGDRLRKVGTREAQELVSRRFPSLLFNSRQRDVQLHGVPLEQIVRHHCPRRRLAQLWECGGQTAMEQKVVTAVSLLVGDPASAARWGVTGSVLIGAGHSRSDIDLVTYDRRCFGAARVRLRDGLEQGTIEPLSETLWQETYERRDCSLSLAEYLWHERRKYNKFQVRGTKVDVSWVSGSPAVVDQPGKKLGMSKISAVVTDDRDAFAYPAVYGVEHPEIVHVISYNPTFMGQAQRGERLVAAGWVERVADGSMRLLVGTSRESPGELISVRR